jgi:multidrug resistance protein, MATE family
VIFVETERCQGGAVIPHVERGRRRQREGIGEKHQGATRRLALNDTAAAPTRELRELLRLSWPIAVAQLGIIAMALVDTAILGRVSVRELAGAAMGRAIGFAAMTMTMGIAEAIEPIASQALGAKDPGRAWQGLLTTLRACVLLWIPSVAVALAATMTFEPLGIEADVAIRSRAFVIGQAPQMLFIGVFLAHKCFLQAHGVTRPALVGSAVANVLNFVVCNLLVRGDDALAVVGVHPLGLPRLGALGAGIALSIATLVMTLFVVVPARALRGDGASAPRVPTALAWKLGVPIGLHMLVEYGVFSTMAVLAGKLGAIVVSAHQIAIALASFTYMGALGVAGATAVRVGRAIGEGRSPRRAGLLGMALGAAFMSMCAVGFAFAPRFLIDLFTDEPGVIALGSKLLLLAAVFQLFDGVQVVAAGALRGAGDVRYPFLANTAAHWLINFPVGVALCFAAGWGVVGLWCGATLGLAAAAIALATRFLSITRSAIARVG